ncbi:ABC transporter permease subunit [Serinicoccus chungangensis]|uniref:ABC transporter permease subunit n=1 Tax=Serinicoccus chungangensis TaxID=767452 RepID=UPI00111AE42F|nr:ABC transporter permease subunit [Serinicoccus chungangensis]
MIRLVAVELQRLRARRIVLLALVASALIAGFALFTVNQQAVQLERARSGADAAFQEQLQWWEENGERERASCLQSQEEERRLSGDATVDFGCEQMQPPTPEQMYGAMPSLAGQYDELLLVLAYPFLLLALLVGSTHVAAEFTHRTMGSWLTFVPRRGVVFASKVVAAAIVALPVVGVGVALVLLGVPAVFRWHGIDGGGTTDQWVVLTWAVVRIMAVGAMAGALGAAAGFLVRHSAVVVGVLLGYLAVVEGILGSSLPATSRFLLGRNIRGFIENGTQWTVYADCWEPAGECREVVERLSFAQSATTLVVVLLLVVGLALWRFLRTDVD